MRILIHNTAANITVRELFPCNAVFETGKSVSAGARDFLTSFNWELRTFRQFSIFSDKFINMWNGPSVSNGLKRKCHFNFSRKLLDSFCVTKIIQFLQHQLIFSNCLAHLPCFTHIFAKTVGKTIFFSQISCHPNNITIWYRTFVSHVANKISLLSRNDNNSNQVWRLSFWCRKFSVCWSLAASSSTWSTSWPRRETTSGPSSRLLPRYRTVGFLVGEVESRD